MRRAAVFCALLLTGCGGGSFAQPSVPASAVPNATPSGAVTGLQFRFTFPARQAAARRRRAYVSPAIASLAIVVDAGAPIYLNAPPASGAPATITAIVPAAAGSHVFAIAEYDAPSGAGNLLGSTGDQSAVVTAGIVNDIAFTLNGNLAKIGIVPLASPFLEGSVAGGFTLVGNAAQQFSAVPEDADGNQIVGPGTIPPIAASSSGSGIVATGLAGDLFTLAAPAPAAAETITLTGQNLAGQQVTATFKAAALAAFYVAQYEPQKIGVYDENGTPLAMPAGAFGGLTNPMGIAYVPPASGGASGSLVVTETSNYAGPFVLSFDQLGNAQALATTAFGNSAQPLELSYANPGGTGEIVVPNYQTSTVTTYDPSGNQTGPASGKFTGLDAPVAVAYDSNNANFYITSMGSATVSRFGPDGTPMGPGVAAGNHPTGAVFDPNNKMIYTVYAGQAPTASNSPPTLAGVMEFSEAPASVSTTGEFAQPSSSAFFTAIAFDPFTKHLYVSDAGNNVIDAFTEAGAAVTQPAGAFAGVSDPMAIVLVP